MSIFAAVGLLYPTTSWSGECMATLKGPEAYRVVGTILGGDDSEVTATVKPGERFLVAPPYATSEETSKWRVYLKSGITGYIDRHQIRLLADEPLMRLNFSASKQQWQKSRSEAVTENDEAAWSAKRHGVDYYDTLVRASEGDLGAIARFESLASLMDGAAAESYFPERWQLFHVVGDDTFARYIQEQAAKTREDYRAFFSLVDADATDPISHRKPYLRQNFPKTYKVIFGRGQ